MTTVLVDQRSLAIMVVNPPRDGQGQPILPEGRTVTVVDLTDAEAAKLSTANAQFSLGADGATVVVTAAAAPPPDPVAQQRVQAINAIKADPHFQQFTPEAQQAFLTIAGAGGP